MKIGYEIVPSPAREESSDVSSKKYKTNEDSTSSDRCKTAAHESKCNHASTTQP